MAHNSVAYGIAAADTGIGAISAACHAPSSLQGSAGRGDQSSPVYRPRPRCSAEGRPKCWQGWPCRSRRRPRDRPPPLRRRPRRPGPCSGDRGCRPADSSSTWRTTWSCTRCRWALGPAAWWPARAAPAGGATREWRSSAPTAQGSGRHPGDWKSRRGKVDGSEPPAPVSSGRHCPQEAGSGLRQPGPQPWRWAARGGRRPETRPDLPGKPALVRGWTPGWTGQRGEQSPTSAHRRFRRRAELPATGWAPELGGTR